MFERYEPLEYSKHKDLIFSKIPSFDFARNISAVKLTFAELRHASRFYPIVFLQSTPNIPQAILSLEDGQNNCIDASGNWRFQYIPAFLRFYPFTMAQIEGEEDKYTLCIDPDADHFKSEIIGDPMFTPDGELTEFMQDAVLNTLGSYQQELKTTGNIFKDLEDKELIIDKTFSITVNQEEKNITGFKGVDMEKLMDLDDTELAGLVRNGSFGLIHEHGNSLSNFINIMTPPALTPPI